MFLLDPGYSSLLQLFVFLSFSLQFIVVCIIYVFFHETLKVSNQDAAGRVLVRRPSGKSTPPPPAPNSGNNQKPLRPKPPAATSKPAATAGGPVSIPSRPSPPEASKKPILTGPQKSVDKPRPVPRKLPAVPSGSEFGQDSSAQNGKKPMLPPKKYSPPKSVDTGDERPLSVSERRKLLEER